MNTNKIYLYILGLCTSLFLASCDPSVDEGPDLAAAPTSSDVTFTFTPDADNPNIIHFSNTSEGSFIFKWDFGNGSEGEGNEVSAAYPLEGEYIVELTVFTAGGQASSSQVLTIAETNFAMLETPAFNALTGGAANAEGKTWIIDSTNAGHMGVGPVTSFFPEFWQAPPLDKANQGLYDDRFTFNLNEFEFGWETNGDIFVNGLHAGDIGGTTGEDQRVSPFSGSNDVSWQLIESADGSMKLTLTGGAFIGFYTGVSEYDVLTLSENEMFIRFLDSKNPDLAWYHRLIPEDAAVPSPPVANFTVSVEERTATFTNTSALADSYTWDFGDGNTSTDENPVHTYASDGVYEVTLTANNDNGQTTTTQPVTIATGVFNLEALTGGSSKTWKLKTGPGNYGVGPGPGALDFFSTDETQRPCVWNDEYTFNADGDFIYNANGDLWVEGYMGLGLPDGCEDISVLDGTPAAIWESGTHSYTFTEAAGEQRATIQLSGLGAFIGLQKAYDGGEFAAVPTESYTSTYQVLSYSNDGVTETIQIGIDVGGAWWNFTLEAQP